MPTQTPLKTEGFAHPRRNVAALGVEPGMNVADFGSGSGVYVLHIAEALENSGRVYAIDVQRDLLQRVKNEAHRRGFKNVDVIWTDLEHAGSSKLADRTLDLVLISNLMLWGKRPHSSSRGKMDSSSYGNSLPARIITV